MMVIDVSSDYGEFLRAKATPGTIFREDGTAVLRTSPPVAQQADTISRVAPHLHQYQRFGAAFALARKRTALFWECGLGKTSVSLSWSASIGGPVLVCAPLAACYEYLDEAARFFPSLGIQLLRGEAIDDWLADPSGVGVATHHAFLRDRDTSRLSGFVLDESSILKSGSGSIAAGLKAAVQHIDYRLALSATPAPNDPTEYAAHATWLGHVKTDAEFRARFFVRDGKEWRMKRHAEQEMPRWLSKWAIWMRDPSTYGMPCAAALPPPYSVEYEAVDSGDVPDVPRDLFGVPLAGMSMSDRAANRKAVWASDDRMTRIVEIVTVPAESGNGTSDQPMQSIVWGRSNAHCDDLEAAIREAGNTVVEQIAGVTSEDERVAILRRFRAGETDCIVSKPSVIGHGVNLQQADLMVWAGYDESYEAQHQAIRRAHRQGRSGTLRVVYLVSPDEERIISTLRAKAERWDEMARSQETQVALAMGDEIGDFMHDRQITSDAKVGRERSPDAVGDWYHLRHGDSIALMRDEMDEESVDLSVFSPPFAALFTYSSEPEDMGNCSEHDRGNEFAAHFAHFAREIHRVMKAGRVVCLHLQQLVAFRSSQGRKGLTDFRGGVIKIMESAGFHYYGEFVIPKNPQAVALRTKSERLQFTQFKRDSLESSPCLNDYMLQFRKPGKQAVRVKNDVSNEEWIRWASGVWDDIRESDVLSGWQGARGEKDEKHICPLQLEVIRRCVRLWSNPGEVVFSPFGGIGSEPYVAIEQGRIGWACELKREYYEQAVANCRASVERHHMQARLL